MIKEEIKMMMYNNKKVLKMPLINAPLINAPLINSDIIDEPLINVLI